MLENPNENFNYNFKIHFGNLKKDYKDNYYLATQEKAVENSTVECRFLADKQNSKYAITIDNVLGNTITRYINLNYFEEWKIEKIV